VRDSIWLAGPASQILSKSKLMERVNARPPAGGPVGIVFEAFRRQADGSWTCIRNCDVITADGAIRIPAGMDFRRGSTLCGVDMAMVLDEESASRAAAARA
jgi:hypothetical protein